MKDGLILHGPYLYLLLVYYDREISFFSNILHFQPLDWLKVHISMWLCYFKDNVCVVASMLQHRMWMYVCLYCEVFWL